VGNGHRGIASGNDRARNEAISDPGGVTFEKDRSFWGAPYRFRLLAEKLFSMASASRRIEGRQEKQGRRGNVMAVYPMAHSHPGAPPAHFVRQSYVPSVFAFKRTHDVPGSSWGHRNSWACRTAVSMIPLPATFSRCHTPTYEAHRRGIRHFGLPPSAPPRAPCRLLTGRGERR
jgi:hypothetical protein